MLAGSEFHTVGAATENIQVTDFVFIRGMWLLLVIRNSLDIPAGVSIEFGYAGCVDKRV